VRLSALSAGEHAPRGRFDGVVHSVFKRSCNVRLDNGRLLALLGPQLANLPHGIRVATAPDFAFADHLGVGQSVGCRADVLRGGEVGLSIDLGKARLWRCDLARLGVDLQSPEATLAWRTAWHALWRHERGALVTAEEGRLDLGMRAASPCEALRCTAMRDAVRLARATRALRADRARAALDRLIGRGPGLTPAGDDLVVGLLAGLRVAGGDRVERLAFLRSLGGAVVDAMSATNEISQAFLRHATVGSVAEPLAVLARNIAEGTAAEEVERATARALSFGHSSGADATLGLLLGLAAWRPAWPFSEQASKIEASG
jgi:hypothetical protein